MAMTDIVFPAGERPSKLLQWKIKEGTTVTTGRVLFLYKNLAPDGSDTIGSEKKFRATQFGKIVTLLHKADERIQPGEPVVTIEGCRHPTIMKDLCAECGVDLRKEASSDERALPTRASVPMVHSVPELKVSPELAQKIGQQDVERLVLDRKLALLVDLDQTIVHTTNDNVPVNMKDVYHYQLYGPHSPWYHTRLRPNTRHFLLEMSKYYEMHICTFGARNYAHKVTSLLDTDGVLFSHRILSRDECFDPQSKTANLKALFPCGDDMVCIIDDREDVWQGCGGNLVQVKPYHFFRHTGDIHAPPGLGKNEDNPPSTGLPEIDDPEGVVEAEVNVENGETLPKTGDSCKKAENDSIEPEQSSYDYVETKITSEEKKDETGEKSEQSKEKKEQSEQDKEKSEEKKEQPEEKKAQPQSVAEQSEVKNKLPEDKKEEYAGKLTAEEQVKAESGAAISQNKGEKDEDHDDYLLYLEDILKRIHEQFYRDFDKNRGKTSLRQVIPYVRSNVLKGVNITFSGLIPTHQKLEQSRAYRVARAFGAEVNQELTEQTTHLVSVRPGTVKVNTAKKNGKIKIVNPEWLWTCAERWEHVDERLYPLTTKVRGSRIPPPHCSSPEQVEDESSKNAESFANSINPLMSFSREEIDNMDKEVDENLEDAEMEEDDNSSSEDIKLSEESIDYEDMEDGVKRAFADDDDEWADKDIAFLKRKYQESSSSDSEEDPVTKFRRGESLPEDLDLGENSQGSVNDLDSNDLEDDRKWNEMGAALEREFLSD